MMVTRWLGPCAMAVAMGGCLVLGWDFDKLPPPNDATGGQGGAGMGGEGPIEPVDIIALGQPNGEARVNLRGGLQGPGETAVCDDMLIVADSNHNRVLIYDPVPSPGDGLREPTTVLGQPDMESDVDNHGGVRAQSMRYPYGLACADGGPLVVADSANHRVLIWMTIPTENQAPADRVLGQDSFAGSAANKGQTVDGKGFDFPSGLALSSTGRLAVADTVNNRVLIWDEIPDVDGAAANVVVGQSGPTESQAAAGADGLDAPYGVAFDPSGKMAVVDFDSNRVLIWDAAPTVDGTPADVVVGQPNFNSQAPNGGDMTIGLDGLDGPGRVAFAGNAMAVSDWQNSRVLIWNAIPEASQTDADLALGQTSGTSTTPNATGITDASLWRPWGLAVHDGVLYVTDEANHRVTTFDSDDAFNPLGVVAGQPDGTTNCGDAGGGIGLETLHWPFDVATDGERLIVSDFFAHRLLIWNTMPTEDQAAADVIVGQADVDEVKGLSNRASADRLFFPRDAAIADGRLIVADANNHRILIWDEIPSSPGTAANVVVGQPSFVASDRNRGGGAAAHTLNLPLDVEVSDGRLLVADTANHRVVVFDEVPTAIDASASLVLGQASLTTSERGLDAAALDTPRAVVSDGEAIYVADAANRRVLVWTGFPESDGAAADFVIGQADFETSSTNVIDANTLHHPSGLALSEDYLFVSDSTLHRILAFALPITESYPAAALVLGQPDFTSGSPNPGGRRGTTLSRPGGLTILGDRLVVADAANSRTLLWRLDALL